MLGLLLATLLSSIAATGACDCKIIDSMARVVTVREFDSILLPCDIPSTWIDTVTVVWTRYPSTQLSNDSRIIVKSNEKFSIVSNVTGEFNLRIGNATKSDKYYCKFTHKTSDFANAVIKAYKVEVQSANGSTSGRSTPSAPISGGIAAASTLPKTVKKVVINRKNGRNAATKITEKVDLKPTLTTQATAASTTTATPNSIKTTKRSVLKGKKSATTPTPKRGGKNQPAGR